MMSGEASYDGAAIRVISFNGRQVLMGIGTGGLMYEAEKRNNALQRRWGVEV